MRQSWILESNFFLLPVSPLYFRLLMQEPSLARLFEMTQYDWTGVKYLDGLSGLPFISHVSLFMDVCIKCMLCARQCVKQFTHNPHSNPQGKVPGWILCRWEIAQMVEIFIKLGLNNFSELVLVDLKLIHSFSWLQSVCLKSLHHPENLLNLVKALGFLALVLGAVSENSSWR